MSSTPVRGKRLPSQAAPSTAPTQVDLPSMMQLWAQAMTQAMVQAQQRSTEVDEWTVVEEPLKREVSEVERETLSSLVSQPSTDLSAKKALKGFPTGTFLDDLFIGEEGLVQLLQAGCRRPQGAEALHRGEGLQPLPRSHEPPKRESR